MLTTLLTEINQQHGTSFVLVERYTHGEHGAFALVDHEGIRSVLKIYPDILTLDELSYASATTQRLRQRGYPAPEYRLIGQSASRGYAIQRALPGQSLEDVCEVHLPQLLALNQLQAGCALPSHLAWPMLVVDPLLHGGDGFCLHEPLQRHSAESAALLARVQVLGQQAASAHFPTNDVVHYDFNPRNLLATGAMISGVVDWEATCAGDRMFDLATLLFYSYEVQAVRECLWQVISEQVGVTVLAIYLAHLCLRQVDWSIRHHDQATVQHWLHRSVTLLSKL